MVKDVALLMYFMRTVRYEYGQASQLCLLRWTCLCACRVGNGESMRI